MCNQTHFGLRKTKLMVLMRTNVRSCTSSSFVRVAFGQLSPKQSCCPAFLIIYEAAEGLFRDDVIPDRLSLRVVKGSLVHNNC